MAWEGSTRNKQNPPGWAKTRKRILARDGGRCYVCGTQGADTVDHVVALALGGTHDDANLAAIHARPCHTRKTSADAQEARRRKPGRFRPPERHPGLIE